jgi:hypothetical protein
MTERHVREFVRHNRGKLCFVVRHFDSTAIDENIAAGQRKRVDGLIVDAVKFERVLHSSRGKFRGQSRPELGQVSIHFGIIAKRQLPLRIGSRPFSDFDVLLRRKHVPARLELCPLSPRFGHRQGKKENGNGTHQSQAGFDSPAHSDTRNSRRGISFSF